MQEMIKEAIKKVAVPFVVPFVRPMDTVPLQVITAKKMTGTVLLVRTVPVTYCQHGQRSIFSQRTIQPVEYSIDN